MPNDEVEQTMSFDDAGRDGITQKVCACDVPAVLSPLQTPNGCFPSLRINGQEATDKHYMGIRQSVAALKPYLSRRIRIKFQSVQILEVFPDGGRGEILAMTMTQLLAFVYSTLPDAEAHKYATGTALGAVHAPTGDSQKSTSDADSSSSRGGGDAVGTESKDSSSKDDSGDRASGSGMPQRRTSGRLQGYVALSGPDVYSGCSLDRFCAL
jgi:hypothetical protein